MQNYKKSPIFQAKICQTAGFDPQINSRVYTFVRHLRVLPRNHIIDRDKTTCKKLFSSIFKKVLIDSDRASESLKWDIETYSKVQVLE